MTMVPADPPHPARGRVLSGYGQLLMLLDRWDESRVILEEALELARADGDRLVEGHALDTLGMDLVALGRAEEGYAATEEAHDIAVEIGNVDEVGRSNVNLANALLYGGETDRAAEIMWRAVREARELGIVSSYGCYAAHQGVQILFEQGRWKEAADLEADALAIQHLEAHADRYGLARWVPLLVATGDPEAGPRLDHLWRLLDGAPTETQFLGNFLPARAEQHLWAGDPAAAWEVIRDGLARLGDPVLPWHPMRIGRTGARALADLAERARASRDAASEAAAIAAWPGLESRIAVTLERARAHHHGASLAEAETEATTISAEAARLRGEESVEAWRAAVDAWVARRRPYPEAYSGWRLAEASLGAGDRRAAGEALAAAHRIATRLGATPLRLEIESLATRARLALADGDAEAGSVAEPVRVATPADPFGLTPREREVLGLLVSGRTNRQIAETLFVSESTAGVHVSNILGKLGVTTRTEAATTAVRLRLVATED
jgi:ATP/maltotriose-dependent transcriptional regulator MalT